MPTDRRVSDVAAEAQVEFWRIVAAKYPEITSGDFPPDAAEEITDAMELAVGRWVEINRVEPDERWLERRATNLSDEAPKRCLGSTDVHGLSACTGPDVHTVDAVSPDGAKFTTNWCVECRCTALIQGYTYVITDLEVDNATDA